MHFTYTCLNDAISLQNAKVAGAALESAGTELKPSLLGYFTIIMFCRQRPQSQQYSKLLGPLGPQVFYFSLSQDSKVIFSQVSDNFIINLRKKMICFLERARLLSIIKTKQMCNPDISAQVTKEN